MSGEKKGWAHRLRLGLGRSRDALTDGVNRLFRSGQVDQATLDELEELLIAADLGVETAGRLAHTAKGVAGNLGAEALFPVAVEQGIYAYFFRKVNQ